MSIIKHISQSLLSLKFCSGASNFLHTLTSSNLWYPPFDPLWPHCYCNALTSFVQQYFYKPSFFVSQLMTSASAFPSSQIPWCCTVLPFFFSLPQLASLPIFCHVSQLVHLQWLDHLHKCSFFARGHPCTVNWECCYCLQNSKVVRGTPAPPLLPFLSFILSFHSLYFLSFMFLLYKPDRTLRYLCTWYHTVPCSFPLPFFHYLPFLYHYSHAHIIYLINAHLLLPFHYVFPLSCHTAFTLLFLCLHPLWDSTWMHSHIWFNFALFGSSLPGMYVYYLITIYSLWISSAGMPKLLTSCKVTPYTWVLAPTHNSHGCGCCCQA